MEPKIVTVSEMQALEAAANASGHSYTDMMERAGSAVAKVVWQALADYRSKARAAPAASSRPCGEDVLILVGPGNNGGDGLVCARQLCVEASTRSSDEQRPLRVRAYLWQPNGSSNAKRESHLESAVDCGVLIASIDDDAELKQLRQWLRDADVVVDALLGTGNERPIGGSLEALLSTVGSEKSSRCLPVVAVDCPTGINCDSGRVDPVTVPADLTVTFGFAKWGHYIFPGAAVLGQLSVADIGIPPELGNGCQTFLITPERLSEFAPVRQRDSHKGTFGKALIAAGCINYPGAAHLVCAAAGRSGAGLVTAAVPASIWPIVAGALAETTWLPCGIDEQSPRTHLSEPDAQVLIEKAPQYDALLLGCGLGHTHDTEKFVAALLSQSDALPPTVIDADGLNCLATMPGWSSRLPSTTIMTPHPAEMSRLTGLSLEHVRADRWRLAREKATEWQAVVLVKGPFTVIAAPDGRLAILPIATPALATAGTGDVLAGTIAGFLAQAVAPFEAACLGAWVQGQAGLRCAEEIGAAGVIASDLLSRLPDSIVSDCRADE